MMSFDFDLELTVVETERMHAIVATYIPVQYLVSNLTRGQLARRHQPSDTGITEY